MSFTLLVCSDIRGQKVNLEFPFQSPPPSVGALWRVVEQTFRHEENAIKLSNGYTDVRPCEPFTIAKLQRYDDDTQSWSDIASPQALQVYDQLYVFRKNSTKADISPQRELPPPRLSQFFESAQSAADLPSRGGSATRSSRPNGSPQQPEQRTLSGTGRSAGGIDYNQYPAGQPQSRVESAGSTGAGRYGAPSSASGRYPTSTAAMSADPGVVADAGTTGSYYKERTTPERIEYLFQVGDANKQGYLSYRGFESIFRASDIRFPSDVIEDLHAHFAEQTQGQMRMSLDGFHQYASNFPVAINIAYQRLTNREREEALVHAQHENNKAAEAAAARVQELERQLADAKKAQAREDARKRALADDMENIQRRRDPDYIHDEQKLLDKEVSVFKYREKLSMEERDYERLTMERRRRSLQQFPPQAVSAVSDNGAYDADRYGPR